MWSTTRLLILLCLPALAWAQTGEATLTWDPNPEPDLTGYRIYHGAAPGQYGATYTAVPVMLPTPTVTIRSLPAGLRYFAATAVNTRGAESAYSNEVSKTIIAQAPGSPCTPVLTVAPASPTSATVSWPYCDDGTGQPAKIDIRYSTPPLSWGAQVNPTIVCPVSPCTVSTLQPDTPYEFQAVAYRGASNLNAVFGPLSAVVAVRTPAVIVTPPPPPPPPPVTSAFGVTEKTEKKIIVYGKIADCPGGITSSRKNTYQLDGKTILDSTITITCKP